MLTVKDKIKVAVLTVVFACCMLAGAAIVMQPMTNAIHAQAAK
jgi:hypothetical protein